MKLSKLMSIESAWTRSMLLVTLASVCWTAQSVAQSSLNGNVQFFSVDSFAAPAGNSNYVSSYTGSLANGVRWTLTGTDAAPDDGRPGGLINPYNARMDAYGGTFDSVAGGFAPWGNSLVIQDGSGTAQSAYNAWGTWAATGGVDYIGQGAQTFESPVDFVMSFSAPLTEIYLYVRELDDGQMSGWNIAPTVVQTASYLLGSVTYDAAGNIVRDWSNTGEGLDVGSAGIPFWDFYSGGTTNPSSAGVLRFYDPNGFSSLSWRTELNPNGAMSDGFQISFATATVPEPSGVTMFGLLGIAGLLFRRR
jgi:hypothetical protein